MKRRICIFLAVVTVFFCLAPSALADEASMTTSEAGITFIKSLEGFSAHKVWDYSQYSIGYGSSCAAGEYPDGITAQEADALLRQKLAAFEQKFNAFIVKNNLALAQPQYDALISFTYNLGTSWFESGCRLSKFLVAGQFTETEFASALGVWCHTGSQIATGLISRRIREVQLFLYGDYSGNNSTAYRYLIFEPFGGSVSSDIYLYPTGSAYGTIPTPTKENRTFLGWFTAAGTQITAASAASADLTVTAKWKTPRPAATVFKDISPNAWYYAYVDELFNDGVIDGYADATFRPSGTVTVGAALKLILLACGASAQTPTAQHWASGYLALAVSRGYVAEGEITSLDTPVSRAMVAKLAAKALRLSAASGTGTFADSTDANAIALYNAGIIEGTIAPSGGRYFYPTKSLTRAELSAIVFRIQCY